MRLYKEVRKRYPKVAIMKIDLTSVPKILKAVADSEREKLDKKRQAAELRLMKEQAVEQARHCVPYVPKLTSAHNLKKQSSLSVLQSLYGIVNEVKKISDHSLTSEFYFSRDAKYLGIRIDEKKDDLHRFESRK